MGKILSLSNQKGGMSKSSSAVNLGAALKMKGKKVLLEPVRIKLLQFDNKYVIINA